MCEALHCLPAPGGLLDQDSYVMFLFEVVLIAKQERELSDAKIKKRQYDQQLAQIQARR